MCDLLFGAEAEHSEHHQSGEHRCEEVDDGDCEGITVAVVVLRVVGGVSNNGPKAEAQSKEDLCRSLPPHLDVCPNFQLEREEESEKEGVGIIPETQRQRNFSAVCGTFG